MKSKNNLFLILLLGCLINLVSCQKSQKITELENQMKQLKDKIESQYSKKNELHLPGATPAFYQSEKWRDPFERPQTTQGDVNSTHSLKNFPLAMLRFIGIISENKTVWGILLTPDNHTLKVKAGDVIGNLNGKIAKIDARQMDVIETMIDDQHRTTQRLVILPLK